MSASPFARARAREHLHAARNTLREARRNAAAGQAALAAENIQKAAWWRRYAGEVRAGRCEPGCPKAVWP